MKLLIVTQKVDRADPILGFFHRWIEGFAVRCERVVAIGHSVGEYALPANVLVESLGKERSSLRFGHVLNLWKSLLKLRREYDVVLVHMTPIWVLLGWPICVLLRKPLYLWYEARGTRWSLRLSLFAVRRVFSASVYGMPISTRKSTVVGHGIDTDLFSPSPHLEHEKSLLVTVGRITRAKHLDVILRALSSLPPPFVLAVVGTPVTNEDQECLEGLQDLMHRLALRNRVTISSLPHSALVPLLQRATLFLHASTTSLDKAILEAMSCGCLVVSTSPAISPFLPSECCSLDKDLVSTTQRILALPSEKKAALRGVLRSVVVEQHSLPVLLARLCTHMMS